MTLATNAEVEEVVSELAEQMARLIELLMVDDETVASTTTSMSCEDMELMLVDDETLSSGKTNFSYKHHPDDLSCASLVTRMVGPMLMELQEKKLKENKKLKTKIDVGDRVEVVIKDKYYGRLGTIRGVEYWNIELDCLKSENAPKIIWKKEGSLRLINYDA
jgi:hypothetical protein